MKKLGKSLYTQKWEILLQLLRRLRKAKGFTQTHVAHELNRPQSLVAKIEAGERKLDICELLDYLEVLEADPIAVIKELQKKSKK